jgi:hypothetical protein
MSSFRLPAALALALLAAAAFAHHSPAAYDQGTAITVEGTVARYDWGNPHVYLSVRDTNGQGERVWEIEAFASTAMKQFGWSAQTFAVGDRVVVTGNPGRNPAKTILFLRTVQKSGAVVFDAARALGPAATATRAAFSASSLSGTWATQVGPAFFQLLPQAATVLPATAKGAAAMAGFRDTANPGADCVPFSAPIYMILPGFRSVEVRDDVVLIRGEDAAVERTVHLALATHGGATATVQGHSIGRWEGDVLVVDTTHFAEHRLGNGGGLPSGAGKHLVERFQRDADGAGMTYSFVLEDPEYLAQPVAATAQWVYRPDVTFAATVCNLDNARRFLAE